MVLWPSGQAELCKSSYSSSSLLGTSKARTSLPSKREGFLIFMTPKILHYSGLAACIALIISCFLPWAYFADINQHFTGLYSYKNEYGRPGKFLIVVAVIVFVFMLLPKVWAKRTNLFICALGVGYAIKSYILFTSCYKAYCPETKPAIFIMLISTIVMLAAAIFPNLKLEEKKEV